MFKIIVECLGIGPDIGHKAASDIEQEFHEHRKWQGHALCRYSDRKLFLTAVNAYDDDGLALLDEFRDCLSALVGRAGETRVRSVEIV